MSSPAPILCKSCQSPLTGKFCAVCGEQVLDRELRSLNYLFKNLLEVLVNFDGKIWRTFLTLLAFPGKLEFFFHIGKRVNYLKPVTLFFTVNIIFVMASPISDFYVNYYDQMHLQPYSHFIAPYVTEFINEQGMNQGDFSRAYDQLVTVLARSLIIIQVPFFALLVSVLCYRKNYYVADHFVFALNFHAWLLLWIIAAQVPARLMHIAASWLSIDVSMGFFYYFLLRVGTGAYLLIAVKTMYQLNWWQGIWRLPILMFGLIACHTIYRFLQFGITLALVK
jgi:hypothetical protein